MNLNPLAEVRAAINAGDINRARDLLRPHLIDQPTADAYYLAYRVAVNDYQRRKFLNQALELDPFNQEADLALQALIRGETAPDANVTPMQSSANPAYIDAKPKRDFSDLSALGGDPSAVQSYELANFGQRFAAIFIDFVIYVLVFTFVIVVIFNPFDQQTMNALNAGDFNVIQRENNSLNLMVLLFNIVYNVYFLTQRDGQTPGKMALGIKIIKTNGQQLSFLDAFLRNVVGYQVSSLVIFLGFLWALGDKNAQTWHDKIVNTVVVKKR
ncbi:MAG: RDD family protein [Aggregatilineales bacterium]